LIAILTVGMNTFTDAIARVSLGVDRRGHANPTDVLPIQAAFDG
jgi:hypothetical protein